jgi:GRIM-19 protein
MKRRMWFTKIRSCYAYINHISFNLSFFNSELRREKAWSRIHLVPILMAEADRDTYRREQAQLAREKEIMKDVKGWEVSIQILINSFRLSHF